MYSVVKQMSVGNYWIMNSVSEKLGTLSIQKGTDSGLIGLETRSENYPSCSVSDRFSSGSQYRYLNVSMKLLLYIWDKDSR